MGADWFMSRARPWGRPSTTSIRQTSASPRWRIRSAVVEPTNPAPTTVTLATALPQRLDHGIGDVGCPDGGRVGAGGLHVPGDARSLRDDERDRLLESSGGLILTEVAQHEDPGQHH